MSSEHIPVIRPPKLDDAEKDYIAHHFNNALAIAYGGYSLMKVDSEHGEEALKEGLERIKNLVKDLTGKEVYEAHK